MCMKTLFRHPPRTLRLHPGSRKGGREECAGRPRDGFGKRSRDVARATTRLRRRAVRQTQGRVRRQAPAGRPQRACPRPSCLESASPHRRLGKPLHGKGPSASIPSSPGKRTLHLGFDDDRRPEGRRPAVRSRARRNAHISEHRPQRCVRRPGASPASRGTRSRASRERGVAACTRTVASAKGAIGFRPRTRCATLSPECRPDSSCPAGCGVGAVGQLVRVPGWESRAGACAPWEFEREC